ncbi:DUF4364 family protein [Christensenellaceae bacterium NSJ-44]|uniref:DUF4364 family protein n=1 Tax=Luoshenia tenuis TaxID=2763654 RepID=A0A926HLS0_9FIRM|nr:DUF4364 family protein [Luoshenia tenuis]MBC8528754.1 DUF4364 family protein [Luoshenia tenuis]
MMDMNTLLANKKLLLLYLIQQLRMPPTNEQLIRLMDQTGYLDYFELQQALFELVENNLLACPDSQSRSGPFHLTAEGNQALELFLDRIPPLLRLEIKHFALASRAELLEENQVVADYQKLSEDEYLVTLKAVEQGVTLFQMELNIATRELAKELCNNWKKRSGLAYRALIDALLNPNPIPALPPQEDDQTTLL